MNKEKYKEFCKNEKNIPIYSQYWWLDALCDEWDVILIEKNNEIIASLPYQIKYENGKLILGKPTLTQSLGPFIIYPEKMNHNKKLSYEKQIMYQLIDNLPEHNIFSQNFHYNITNWLPFYWKGFSQYTRYTYIIPDLSNLNTVFKNFEHSKRKNIKKAEKTVYIKYNISSEEFYNNHKMILQKQNEKISYTREMFYNLYNSVYLNKSGCTIGAYDISNNLHAALFIAWDKLSAYDLISTIDPDFRNYGAASLLVKEAIKYVSKKVNKFDFEGSMKENVETSFRRFGAIQTPYFHIEREIKC